MCRERSKKIDPSYQLATVAIKGKIDPTFISLILLHKYSAPHNNKTFLAREHGNWLKMSSQFKEKKKSSVKDATNSDDDVDSEEVESNKKSKLKEKKKVPVKDVTNSDEDVESVESFSSTSSV